MYRALHQQVINATELRRYASLFTEQQRVLVHLQFSGLAATILVATEADRGIATAATEWLAFIFRPAALQQDQRLDQSAVNADMLFRQYTRPLRLTKHLGE